MRVFYGQGAQVSAGVYGGGCAAGAAYAGGVQVHPEGGEALTLDVLATTTGSAHAYRLLRWWHENYVTGAREGDLQPLFHVPWVAGEDSGRFVASGFEIRAVTPTMVYVRLDLALPEGIEMEDVHAALAAGECVHLLFRGGAWIVSGNVQKVNGGNTPEYTLEFDGPLFLGSSGAAGSALVLDAPGVDRVTSMTLQVELDGQVKLHVKAGNGNQASWSDTGETTNMTVVASESVCDVGRVRITVAGVWNFVKVYPRSYRFTPAYSLACRASGQAGTHAAIPLELA